jgi:hypothetical protein
LFALHTVNASLQLLNSEILTKTQALKLFATCPGHSDKPDYKQFLAASKSHCPFC